MPRCLAGAPRNQALLPPECRRQVRPRCRENQAAAQRSREQSETCQSTCTSLRLQCSGTRDATHPLSSHPSAPEENTCWGTLSAPAPCGLWSKTLLRGRRKPCCLDSGLHPLVSTSVHPGLDRLAPWHLRRAPDGSVPAPSPSLTELVWSPEPSQAIPKPLAPRAPPPSSGSRHSGCRSNSQPLSPA